MNNDDKLISHRTEIAICLLCEKEVTKGIEHEAYEVTVNKWAHEPWTAKFPQIVESYAVHDKCWSQFSLTVIHLGGGTQRRTLSDWFGIF